MSNVKTLHHHICDFIKRWKNPPLADDCKSLDMISDFFLCANLEMEFKEDESTYKILAREEATHENDYDVEYVKFIINVLLESGDLVMANQWQPIESAPKDTAILLNVVGYPWGTVGVWNEPSKKWCYVQLQADLYEGEWTDISFQNEYEATVDSKGFPNVAHWMPLPKPPQEK